ncbi:hypothetical protein HKX48_003952 [Thoreauomyces humboldtii]|nr:hypothetical protein HKX48_003952 [Thoreauomyces humboldtii]
MGVVACGSVRLLEAFEEAGAWDPYAGSLFLPGAAATGDLNFCKAAAVLFSRLAKADLMIGFLDAALLAVKRRDFAIAAYFASFVREWTLNSLSHLNLPQTRALFAAIYRTGWEEGHDMLGHIAVAYRRLDEAPARIRQCPMFHCGQGGHADLAKRLVHEAGWVEDEVFLGLAGASVGGDVPTAHVFLDAIASIEERRARDQAASSAKTQEDFWGTPVHPPNPPKVAEPPETNISSYHPFPLEGGFHRYGSVIEMAADQGHLDLVELLAVIPGVSLKSSGQILGSQRTVLSQVVGLGDCRAMHLLIAHGADLDEKKGAALLAALTNKRWDCATFLIESGASIDGFAHLESLCSVPDHTDAIAFLRNRGARMTMSAVVAACLAGPKVLDAYVSPPPPSDTDTPCNVLPFSLHDLYNSTTMNGKGTSMLPLESILHSVLSRDEFALAVLDRLIALGAAYHEGPRVLRKVREMRQQYGHLSSDLCAFETRLLEAGVKEEEAVS